MRTALVTIAAVALAGVGAIVGAATEAPASLHTTANLVRYAADPAEDSPQFNCAKHGNEQCGVSIDPTPNDGRTQVVRYVVQFDNGKAISIRPLGR